MCYFFTIIISQNFLGIRANTIYLVQLIPASEETFIQYLYYHETSRWTLRRISIDVTWIWWWWLWLYETEGETEGVYL